MTFFRSVVTVFAYHLLLFLLQWVEGGGNYITCFIDMFVVSLPFV